MTATKIDKWREFLWYSDPGYRNAAEAHGYHSRQANKAMFLFLTERIEYSQKEMKE